MLYYYISGSRVWIYFQTRWLITKNSIYNLAVSKTSVFINHLQFIIVITNCRVVVSKTVILDIRAIACCIHRTYFGKCGAVCTVLYNKLGNILFLECLPLAGNGIAVLLCTKISEL